MATQKTKQGITRLLEISGEKKYMLIFSSICSILASVCTFIPYFAGYMITCQFIVMYEDLSIMDRDEILMWGFIAIGGVIVTMILNGVAFSLSHFAAYRILYNTRLALARHLAKLPLGYFTATSKGEIHKTLQDNVELIENFIAHKIPESIMTIAGALALFVFFLSIDWVLGLVCIGAYILALAIQFSLYRKGSYKTEVQKFFTHLENINASSMEFVRGIAIIRIFGKSIHSFQSFMQNLQDYKNYVLRFSKNCMPYYVAFSTIVHCFIFFILPIAAFFIAKEPNDIVYALTILCFFIFSNGLIAPLLKILTLSGTMMTINEGVARIDKIFQTKPLKQSENPKIPKDFTISFENVSFGYDKAKSILRNISFELKKGETLAIIGKSGAGKSTILSLLARFYDVDCGSIRIGDIDIREMTESSLMDKLSFVFQDSFLFFDSLRENIRVGKKDASEEEILKAIKLAQCEEIIEKYGLECVIGANGMNLSGGEKQRINIARAILKNAPILLLDEITANLDIDNEIRITKALENLKKDKSVIIIAHKLQTILHADKILFLEKGRIIAYDTHENLLQNSPQYQEYFNLYHHTDTWHISNKS